MYDKKLQSGIFLGRALLLQTNMRSTRFSFVAFLLFLSTALHSQGTAQNQPAWWPDASFGILFHLGLYSVPAGELNGKAVDGPAEMIMKNAGIAVADYERYALEFNPQSFNAREWADLAKNSGARYVMIAARYRDGFCMWDSKVTRYDVVDTAAYRRDIVGQLAKAVRDVGLKFGVYYSLEDWYYEQTKPNGAVDEYRENFVKPQLRELVENYNTDVVLLDKGGVDSWSDENTNDVIAYLRSLKPSLVIGLTNEKLSADYSSGTDITTKGDELRLPMSDSWGYKHNDTSWKKSRDLIATLIDANVSGGNFTVGIGAKHFGTFAPEAIYRLSELGEWMKQYSEAILTTVPFESPDANPTLKVTRSKDNKWIYAILTEPGQKDFRLSKIKLRKGIKPVVLGTTKPVSVSENRDGYTFKLPDGYSYEYACVVKIPVTP